MGRFSTYLASIALLLAAALLVFRALPRREYKERGRLTLYCSLLQLAVWLGHAALPHLYNPPCWPILRRCPSSAPGLETFIC